MIGGDVPLYSVGGVTPETLVKDGRNRSSMSMHTGIKLMRFIARSTIATRV
jgi:hypothetical protein